MRMLSILTALATMFALHFLYGREGIDAADPDGVDAVRENRTKAALHINSQQNDVESVRRLIADGADPNRQLQGVRNWAPLHFAARTNAVEAAKELLAAGADVNLLAEIAGPRPAYSPLDVAAENGSLGVAEVLLHHGAKIDANPDEATRSALHCATNGLYRTRDEFLRVNKLGEISFGNGEMIELLIKHEASLKQPDYRGNLPIHVATNRYAADTISYLLDKHRDQIDIDVRGEFQRTALMMAVEGAVQRKKGGDGEPIRREVIRLLVESGADPDLKSGLNEVIPLQAARRKGLSAKIIELLAKEI